MIVVGTCCTIKLVDVYTSQQISTILLILAKNKGAESSKTASAPKIGGKRSYDVSRQRLGSQLSQEETSRV